MFFSSWATQDSPHPRSRGGACACGGFGVVNTRNVGMLAWKLKWPLSCDRLDFQVNMCPGVCFPPLAMQTSPRARWPPRARVVHNRNAAMLAWKLKLAFSGGRFDFQVNIKISSDVCVPPWALQDAPRRRVGRRARVLSTIEKSRHARLETKVSP